MSEGTSNERTDGFSSLRYFVLSLLSTLFIAASLVGYLSVKPEFSSLLGDYQEVMNANWVAFLLIGAFFGVVNLVISLAKR